MSPFECLTGKKPNLALARVFRCVALVFKHFPEYKVHSKISPAIHLECNYHGALPGQTLYNRKIITSVNDSFDETNLAKLELEEDSLSHIRKTDSGYSDSGNDSIFIEL